MDHHNATFNSHNTTFKSYSSNEQQNNIYSPSSTMITIYNLLTIFYQLWSSTKTKSNYKSQVIIRTNISNLNYHILILKQLNLRAKHHRSYIWLYLSKTAMKTPSNLKFKLITYQQVHTQLLIQLWAWEFSLTSDLYYSKYLDVDKMSQTITYQNSTNSNFQTTYHLSISYFIHSTPPAPKFSIITF